MIYVLNFLKRAINSLLGTGHLETAATGTVVLVALTLPPILAILGFIPFEGLNHVFKLVLHACEIYCVIFVLMIGVFRVLKMVVDTDKALSYFNYDEITKEWDTITLEESLCTESKNLSFHQIEAVTDLAIERHGEFLINAKDRYYFITELIQINPDTITIVEYDNTIINTHTIIPMNHETEEFWKHRKGELSQFDLTQTSILKKGNLTKYAYLQSFNVAPELQKEPGIQTASIRSLFKTIAGLMQDPRNFEVYADPSTRTGAKFLKKIGFENTNDKSKDGFFFMKLSFESFYPVGHPARRTIKLLRKMNEALRGSESVTKV